MFKDGLKSGTASVARLIVVLLAMALIAGYAIPAHYAFGTSGPEEYPAVQPGKYTVTYNANGGAGDPPTDYGYYGPGGKTKTRIKD
ncbi:MAG: hypothetical protein FWG03_11450, partial [Clostridiales bacterium]|nr:hypothetical protein [Clostridiales bacterium]